MRGKVIGTDETYPDRGRLLWLVSAVARERMTWLVSGAVSGVVTRTGHHSSFVLSFEVMRRFLDADGLIHPDDREPERGVFVQDSGCSYLRLDVGSCEACHRRCTIRSCSEEGLHMSFM